MRLEEAFHKESYLLDDLSVKYNNPYANTPVTTFILLCSVILTVSDTYTTVNVNDWSLNSLVFLTFISF